MNELQEGLTRISYNQDINKNTIITCIEQVIKDTNYEIAEENTTKPWGAYFRFNGDQADEFVNEFFTGLSPEEARLGVAGVELSPKILLVSPGERLSWQYHNRRAERWAFLNAGSYNKSESDEPGEAFEAKVGDVVQFEKSERHRLNGALTHYTIVAEIWQHTDASNPSNEDDIVRLIDDYKR